MIHLPYTITGFSKPLVDTGDHAIGPYTKEKTKEENAVSLKAHYWRKTKITGWTVLCLIGVFSAATLLDPLSASQAQTSEVPSAVPGSFSQLASKASPSVVNIRTVKTAGGSARCHYLSDPMTLLRTFSTGFKSEAACFIPGLPNPNHPSVVATKFTGRGGGPGSPRNLMGFFVASPDCF